MHYTNPMTNCIPEFQQRVLEIKALEDKTRRWERRVEMKKQQHQRLLQQSSKAALIDSESESEPSD